MTAPADHDAYLATRPADQRAALAHLRGVIRDAAPGAAEVISYGIPAFRLGPRGKVIAGYAGMEAHCGLYFFEGDLVARFADRLSGYSTDKGTIRFSPQAPLPDALVHEMIAARLARIA